MPKTALPALIAAMIAASAPACATAQLTPPPPAATGLEKFDAQLARLAARIDSDLKLGLLSQQAADGDLRRINDLQAQLGDDRQQHGGRLTTADRFDLQSKIDQLKAELRRQRANHARPGGG